MRTTQEKPIKKENLLDAAFELMMAKGYVATSVDEICEKAKTTKGSFFHYFENKEDLAKALLTRKCNAQQKIKEELFGKDPYKRVFGHLDILIEMSKKPSGTKACIKGMLGQELSDTHPEIRKICADHFEKVTHDFAQDLAKCKEAVWRVIFEPPIPLQNILLLFCKDRIFWQKLRVIIRWSLRTWSILKNIFKH